MLLDEPYYDDFKGAYGFVTLGATWNYSPVMPYLWQSSLSHFFPFHLCLIIYFQMSLGDSRAWERSQS